MFIWTRVLFRTVCEIKLFECTTAKLLIRKRYYVYVLFLMTDTMISQNFYLSSWDTLYIKTLVLKYKVFSFGPRNSFKWFVLSQQTLIFFRMQNLPASHISCELRNQLLSLRSIQLNMTVREHAKAHGDTVFPLNKEDRIWIRGSRSGICGGSLGTETGFPPWIPLRVSFRQP